MATPHAKMEEEGLPKVRTWAWGRAKWRRRAAATATHGVPAESAMDGSHGISEGLLFSLMKSIYKMAA